MGYRFKEGESVPEGIKRICLDQIDTAHDRLSLKTRNRDRAVHDARVALRRLELC